MQRGDPRRNVTMLSGNNPAIGLGGLRCAPGAACDMPWGRCDDSDDEDVSNFPSSLTDFTPPTVQEVQPGWPGIR